MTTEPDMRGKTVIRNAKLVDGSAAPARMADVSFEDGVVTEITDAGGGDPMLNH